MSRSGYCDDVDNYWELIRWRGQVASAIRGKRGQAFFRDLIAALDAMPEKKLIADAMVDEAGCVCALGAGAIAKGIDPKTLNPENYEQLGAAFNIAYQLAQEAMHQNDDASPYFWDGDKWRDESAEERWKRMRAWAVSNLKA